MNAKIVTIDRKNGEARLAALMIEFTMLGELGVFADLSKTP